MKFLLGITFAFFLLTSFSLPIESLAVTDAGGGGVTTPTEQPRPAVTPPTPQEKPKITPPTEQPRPNQQSVEIKNPLGDQTITGFFLQLIDILLIFALPIIVFFIIYAGFMYVMAQGKPADIEKANRALLYAVIGGVIILGAKLILEVIQGTVDAFIS